MAVIEHAVHNKVRIEANKPYGCHNRTLFSVSYHAPNRAAGTNGYQPVWFYERVRIPHVMSRECRYDMSLTDPRCEGCKNRGSGEKYDAMVRSEGT